MKKLFSLLLILILIISTVSVVSAAETPDKLEVVSSEEVDVATADTMSFAAERPGIAEPNASYASILIGPGFIGSTWEKDEVIYIPFILSGGKYSSEQYYVKIYDDEGNIKATASGFTGSSLLRNLTVSWSSKPAAGTYYINCYTSYRSSSSKYPFYVDSSANQSTDVYYNYSATYEGRPPVEAYSVNSNWSNPHYAPDALIVDAPSGVPDYLIQLTGLEVGSSANAIAEDENSNNRTPPSGMHYIIMEFWLYNYGSSTLNADDVLSTISSSKRYWTSYGQEMTIIDSVTFSGDRDDHGIYDVTLSPGEGDFVYVGLLTKINQGLPRIALKTAGGWTYIDTNPTDMWYQYDGCWYFYPADGSYATGWEEIDGTWYYFDEYGVMQSGNIIIDGELHQFSNGGKWLGKYTKAGWVQVSGWSSGWYYVLNGGQLATGWQVIDGRWYYFDSEGAMLTGWQQIKGEWFYLNNYMMTGWQKIDGSWYYFGNSGVMATGWEEIQGKWYYMGSSGVMHTGWQQINGEWFYLNSYMVTGWQKINGSWYYMKPTGAMATSWQQIGGSWYYFGTSGVMHKGWLLLNNNWFYMNSSGVMLTGIHVIDGVTYNFGNNGIMQ